MSFRCFLCDTVNKDDNIDEIKFTCCGYYFPSRRNYHTFIKAHEKVGDSEKKESKMKLKMIQIRTIINFQI